jgi:[histone H3]-lysine36 N-dimethyltransferase SETMAR
VHVTMAYYSRQLDSVAEAVRVKRPDKNKIILQHDNARPHVGKLTKTKLNELGWEVLPSYSPDLAPSDYHLFRDLQVSLDDVLSDSDEEVKNWLQNYFDSMSHIFYRRGIDSVPTKWAKVIDNNGEYFD